MICPQCKAEDMKSCVSAGMMTRTLLYCPSYWDESGKEHAHDSNVTTTEYRCSNGHAWTEKSSGSCWCGWGKE